MSITGDRDTAPLRVGYPVGDSIGGITAAFAIAGASPGAERSGRGGLHRRLDARQSTLATMGWVVSNYLIAGQEPVPMGNSNFHCRALRRVRDERRPAQHRRQQAGAVRAPDRRSIGREDLRPDPRFAQREARKRNRAALTVEIEAALAARSAAEWEALLNRRRAGRAGADRAPGAGPANRCRSAAWSRRSTITRCWIARFRPADWRLQGSRTGTRAATSPPPELGRTHRRGAGEELGYSSAELERLRAEAAI